MAHVFITLTFIGLFVVGYSTGSFHFNKPRSERQIIEAHWKHAKKVETQKSPKPKKSKRESFKTIKE
jgi:hypothetical protein